MEANDQQRKEIIEKLIADYKSTITDWFLVWLDYYRPSHNLPVHVSFDDENTEVDEEDIEEKTEQDGEYAATEYYYENNENGEPKINRLKKDLLQVSKEQGSDRREKIQFWESIILEIENYQRELNKRLQTLKDRKDEIFTDIIETQSKKPSIELNVLKDQSISILKREDILTQQLQLISRNYETKVKPIFNDLEIFKMSPIGPETCHLLLNECRNNIHCLDYLSPNFIVSRDIEVKEDSIFTGTKSELEKVTKALIKKDYITIDSAQLFFKTLCETIDTPVKETINWFGSHQKLRYLVIVLQEFGKFPKSSKKHGTMRWTANRFYNAIEKAPINYNTLTEGKKNKQSSAYKDISDILSTIFKKV